jgi:hypothetical protein
VGADYGFIAVVLHIVLQLPGMADVGQIDGGGDPRGTVHGSGVVHHAKNIRCFGRNAVEHLIKAQGAGLPAQMEHIQKVGGMAQTLQGFSHGHGTVVVAFAGAATQQKDLHEAPPVGS